MDDEPEDVEVIQPSRRRALLYFCVGAAAILMERLFVYFGQSTGKEHFDYLFLFVGGAMIVSGCVEFFRRSRVFAFTPDGFEDRSTLGIGVVGWVEVQRFRVTTAMFTDGTKVLVFDPVNRKSFWAARRSLSGLWPWVGYWVARRAVMIHWVPLAESVEDAADLMNEYLDEARDRAANGAGAKPA